MNLLSFELARSYRDRSGDRHLPFMSRFGNSILVGFVFLLLTAAFFSQALAACPSAEKIKSNIERLAHKKVFVLSIGPSAVSSLCEVVVNSDSQNQVFYTDLSGTLFLFGNLINATNGNNLSRQTLDDFNRLKKPEMEELEFFTAFSIGNDSAPILYYVTDPQCPYCKRGEEDLKKLAADGKLHVRFLLFPLQSHEGAFEQCVSVICDGKGLDEFENGYRSENQCEDGRLLVESTVDFLKKQGVNSTPTYIFSDGRFHGGLLKTAELLKRLDRARPATNDSPAAPPGAIE